MTTTSVKTDAEAPYLPSFGRLLGFASKAVSELSESKLAVHDLTLQQWILLTALWHGDGLTVSNVAAYYQAREPTVSKLIDRMVTKNLVMRKSDPVDRRVVRVYLTSKGEKLAPLIDFYKEINERALRGFTEEEVELFTAFLHRVTKNAQADLAVPEKAGHD